MRTVIRVAVLLAALVALPAWADKGRLSAQDRRTFEAVFQHLEARQYDRARALAASAGNHLLAKLVLWLDLTRPQDGGDFAEAAGFIAENPHWPFQDALQRRAEVSMPGGLPPREVLAWFKDREPLTPQGVMRLAEALSATGQMKAASDLVRKAWINLDLNRSEETAFRRRYMRILKRADFIARLDRLLWEGKSGPARDQARRLGKGYLELTEARLALAGVRPGVDSAIARVPKRLQDDPGLTYERARWRLRKQRYRDAVPLLDGAALPEERRAQWWGLKHWAAREALAERDYKSAYQLARTHGLESGIGFADGEWLAGWIALAFLREPEQAYRHFARLYNGVSTPISLSRGAFWAGEAARAMDNEPWATRWYEVAAEHGSTFYGQLAAQRLGQPVALAVDAAPAPQSEARARFERNELVRLVRLLGELDQRDHQEIFLLRLRLDAESRDDFVLAAELAHDQGRPDHAVQIAKRARDRGLMLGDLLFPLPPLAEAAQPEPALVLALIRQESAFYSQAISPAGARGLMQLMPGTAKREASRLKLGYNHARLTSDAAYNLRLGRSYLADMLERFDGSYVLALAAYNAGPSRAQQWVRKFGDPRRDEVDAIDWIELIPFAETRNYVQRVLEGVLVYRQRLGVGRTPLPLDSATAALPGTGQ